MSEQEYIDRYRELVRGNHGPDYRGFHPNVDAYPDNLVASLMVFQLWMVSERLRELGRALIGLVPGLKREITK